MEMREVHFFPVLYPFFFWMGAGGGGKGSLYCLITWKVTSPSLSLHTGNTAFSGCFVLTDPVGLFVLKLACVGGSQEHSLGDAHAVSTMEEKH